MFVLPERNKPRWKRYFTIKDHIYKFLQPMLTTVGLRQYKSPEEGYDALMELHGDIFTALLSLLAYYGAEAVSLNKRFDVVCDNPESAYTLITQTQEEIEQNTHVLQDLLEVTMRAWMREQGFPIPDDEEWRRPPPARTM